MNDDKGYPRFQFSVFDKNGRDAQWVVRGDDETKFFDDVKLILTKLHPLASSTQTTVVAPVAASPTYQTMPSGYTCPCGAMVYKEGTNAKGQHYKGYFCPTKNPDHKPVWVK